MYSLPTISALNRPKPRPKPKRRRDRFAPVLTALLDDLSSLPMLLPGDPQVLRLAKEELERLRSVPAAWLREQSPKCVDGGQVQRATLKLLRSAKGGG